MGDTITGCTWLAGFEGGHNYRVHPFNWLALLFSCSGRASCSPPLLLLLFKIFFHSFLSLHFSSTLNLCLLSLSLSFCIYLFSLEPSRCPRSLHSLFLWLASPGLLLSAGAAAPLFVQECRWVFFEDRRNPESLGSLLLSINQAWPPHVFIHNLCVYSRAEMLLCSKKWKTTWENLVDKQHKSSCTLLPARSDDFKQIRNESVALSHSLQIMRAETRAVA